MLANSLSRPIILAISTLLAVSACSGSGSVTPASEAPTATAAASEGPPTSQVPPASAAKLRAALIVNQRFGDKGPIDAFGVGLDRCATDFGFEVKRLESIEPAAYEEDIRAIAQEGYDLIITVFPPMTPATTAVAAEFPDTKFRAVYQYINVDAVEFANVESTEYQGQEATYIIGAMAAMLSKTHELGAISGDEDPAINSSVNAFGFGARDVDPSVSVEFAFAGSFEDPAKGKEIAKAMISRGVDFIQTEAAKTQLGVIDAAKEAGILFSGDVADNYDLYPAGFAMYHGLDFGQDVYLGCKEVAEGTWKGGTHGVIDLASGGYFVPWDAVQRWADASPDWTAAGNAAIAKGKELEAKIKSGEVKVPYDVSTPKAINP